MIILTSSDQQTITGTRIYQSFHQTEAAHRFDASPTFSLLDENREIKKELNGERPTSLTFLGHSSNVGKFGDQNMGARLFALQIANALNEARLKIDNIYILSCYTGLTRLMDDEYDNYAQIVANELFDLGHDIVVKTFSNISNNRPQPASHMSLIASFDDGFTSAIFKTDTSYKVFRNIHTENITLTKTLRELGQELYEMRARSKTNPSLAEETKALEQKYEIMQNKITENKKTIEQSMTVLAKTEFPKEHLDASPSCHFMHTTLRAKQTVQENKTKINKIKQIGNKLANIKKEISPTEQKIKLEQMMIEINKSRPEIPFAENMQLFLSKLHKNGLITPEIKPAEEISITLKTLVDSLLTQFNSLTKKTQELTDEIKAVEDYRQERLTGHHEPSSSDSKLPLSERRTLTPQSPAIEAKTKLSVIDRKIAEARLLGKNLQEIILLGTKTETVALAEKNMATFCDNIITLNGKTPPKNLSEKFLLMIKTLESAGMDMAETKAIRSEASVKTLAGTILLSFDKLIFSLLEKKESKEIKEPDTRPAPTASPPPAPIDPLAESKASLITINKKISYLQSRERDLLEIQKNIPNPQKAANMLCILADDIIKNAKKTPVETPQDKIALMKEILQEAGMEMTELKKIKALPDFLDKLILQFRKLTNSLLKEKSQLEAKITPSRSSSPPPALEATPSRPTPTRAPEARPPVAPVAVAAPVAPVAVAAPVAPVAVAAPVAPAAVAAPVARVAVAAPVARVAVAAPVTPVAVAAPLIASSRASATTEAPLTVRQKMMLFESKAKETKPPAAPKPTPRRTS